MKGFLAIYLREILLLKKRFFRVLLSFSINPLLYIMAFGIGLGKGIFLQGRSYLEFLIPGLISASSMLQAFAINVEINVARFYLKVFEEFQSAPLSSLSYALGEVFSGVTRAFLSVILILLLAQLFGGVKIQLNPLFFMIVFLNAFIFASLGLASAMTIKAHADQTLITNFIITPMMFLGGTFFPVENLPGFIKPIIEILPLTLVSHNLRSLAWGQGAQIKDILILCILALVFFVLSIYTIQRAKD
ncbi:ABC transporter [Caldimicrobium thiodismutans]|jgi:Nod factor-specific ABC transporter NodJ protein|uniref:Transport permease protein n=1 Tax=Caldimicrobium thiodismutans TaxID=1653476 RepID=A0A0U5AQB4_9BACT|nr:ABC transporter permease [Caldimicrobium thiodismutans]BAU23041.1 ABC transporter [Caldimicrobium thiodismutans]